MSLPNDVTAYEAGTEFTISFNYNVNTGDNTLNGLSMDVHFDPTKVAYVIANCVNSCLFGFNVIDDTNNLDGDDATTRAVRVNWADFAG